MVFVSFNSNFVPCNFPLTNIILSKAVILKVAKSHPLKFQIIRVYRQNWSRNSVHNSNNLHCCCENYVIRNFLISLFSRWINTRRCEMTFLISTVLLTAFVTATLPRDSVLYDRKSVDTDDEGVTWVLQGSEVSLKCRVNTSRCGQYHNVKGRFRNFRFFDPTIALWSLFSTNSPKRTSQSLWQGKCIENKSP